jgi:hypothetical protein
MEHGIYELRRYRLRRDAREAMIEIFERDFIETQETLGIELPGQFRDLDDPDTFVWLRSFEDMTSRATALSSFYTGPAWKQSGSAANATMINSDNVLLLKPHGASPFQHNVPKKRRDESAATGLLIATTCSLAPGMSAEFATFFEKQAQPLLSDAGARMEATFVTEESENSFPRLPVRQGETVFVWFAGFENEAAWCAFEQSLAHSRAWNDDVFPHLDGLLWRRWEVAQLVPTSRSVYRW